MDIEAVLNNQSVGAFIGALSAFFLVALTDWRRNRRKAYNLVLEIDNAKDHAERKRSTVIENRDDVRNHNRVSPGRFMRFNSNLIRSLSTEVLDQLSPEQRRAIDAVCFRMEGVDQLLDEAFITARVLNESSVQADRAQKVKELIDHLDDAIINLGILTDMCEQFRQKKYDELLNAQHDRSRYEA
jgi:hypothetical protein